MDQFLDSWHSYRFRYCSVNNLGLIIAQIIFSLFTFFMTPSPSVVGQILYRLSAMMVFLVYNYIADREYNGVSIGKKILGIKTVIPADKKEIYCITHGLLRLFFSNYNY